MTRLRPYALPVAAMALVVLASNVLVQFPVPGTLGGVALGDVLTLGAFTYPLAFLVTDLTNRLAGPRAARRAVYAGFAVAVLASVLAPPILFDLGLVPFETESGRLARIALASGAAFLLAQLLDIAVFDRLRAGSWWKAPAVSTLAGSSLDTTLFFSLAFAPAFALLGPGDGFALEAAPLLGALDAEVPRWVSWALGDFLVKLAFAALALVPYRLLVGALTVPREFEARA